MNGTSVSDEDFFIAESRSIAVADLAAAKSCLLTAKLMFPNSFKIYFESYLIEKKERSIKGAALCFSEIKISKNLITWLLENFIGAKNYDRLSKFNTEPDFLFEINKITNTIQSKTNEFDVEAKFLSEMFSYLTPVVQNHLLFFRTENCKDTMEHCKMLLLILQKFPENMNQYGIKFIDTLLNADRFTEANNPYRQMLICDLIPLLMKKCDLCLDLNQKPLLYQLLNKSIEYYVLEVRSEQYSRPTEENKMTIDSCWRRLFQILEFIGTKLGWDPNIISFCETWNKQSYWQKVQQFFDANKYLKLPGVDENKLKQAVYSLTIFTLYCVHEYYASLNIKSSETNIQLLLTHSLFKNCTKRSNLEESKIGKVVQTNDNLTVLCNAKNFQSAINNYFTTFKYWSLLHSSEAILKEFQKTCSVLKIDSIFTEFRLDYLFFINNYEESIKQLNALSLTESTFAISRRIRLLAVCHLSKLISIRSFFEQMLNILQALPTYSVASTYKTVTINEDKRTLFFLPLARNSILFYCIGFLIETLQGKLLENSALEDNLIGNLVVLTQADWPQHEELVIFLLERILKKKRLVYHLFQKYIINIDILEEILHLATDQGGSVTFDFGQPIEPPATSTIIISVAQRRTFVKKYYRDELKQFVQKQLLRCHESVGSLLTQFILTEQHSILTCMGII